MSAQAPLSKLYHCVYAPHYHSVVVTRYRRRCLTPTMLERLREIGAARCAGWNGTLLELNGEPDHVHLPRPAAGHDPTPTPEQPETASSGPVGERMRALLGALERRERRLGLAP